MKIKRRSTAIAAVVLGVCVLTTSALADVIVGSGYLSLKDSVKTTAKFLTEQADSYTIKASYKLKEGNNVFSSEEVITKTDFKNQKSESIGSRTEKNVPTSEHYTYSDSNMSVDRFEGQTFAAIYDTPTEISRGHNPFEDEVAQDLEKVADAFAGSLQDVVQAEEKDGKKMYICNVDSSQIPMYVNAMISLGIKYGFFEEYTMEQLGLPEVRNDIYVSNASAKISTNENNIITDAVLVGEFKGKEKNGTEHTFQFEVLYELTDINTTVIETPDISNADVSYVETREDKYVMSFPETDIAKYSAPKTDIVDGKMVKVGESTLEITGINEGSVVGHYHEVSTADGTESVLLDFDFNANVATHDDSYYGAKFEYQQDGETKYGILRKDGELEYSIEFDVTFDSDGDQVDSCEVGQYVRVFD